MISTLLLRVMVLINSHSPGDVSWELTWFTTWAQRLERWFHVTHRPPTGIYIYALPNTHPLAVSKHPSGGTRGPGRILTGPNLRTSLRNTTRCARNVLQTDTLNPSDDILLCCCWWCSSPVCHWSRVISETSFPTLVIILLCAVGGHCSFPYRWRF